MCGIFGYIGKRDNPRRVGIKALKRLEYRGYDSAGIAVVGTENTLRVVKSVGKVAALEDKLRRQPLRGSIFICHTRWATHGAPSELNAHPHLDCKKEIALVHNGIIENYGSLKNLLLKEGHKILSQTDTEIIAHLIEKFYDGDLEKAVKSALKLLEGAFGLAIMHKNEPLLIAARRGSPLLIGKGANEMFIASDAAAVLPYTKEVVYLDDNEIAVVRQNGFFVKNLDGESVEKEVQQLKWTVEEIEKGGYKHFMLKEIFEQPDAIANTLRGRICPAVNLPVPSTDPRGRPLEYPKAGRIKLSLNIKSHSIRRIIILACGTSWHSSLVGKHILERLTRIPTEVDYGSEFRYREPVIEAGDLAVAISQSGETADTLGAIREAKARGAETLGIINVVGSTISREVDSGIFLHAGPEIGVASTKAFTCQLAALTLFALYLQQARKGECDEELLKELAILPLKIKEILKNAEQIKEIALKIKHSKNCLYLGRGVNFPVALEGALKLKEISYIHAEGYPAAEMKHGPIALIDENMPVVFIATKDHAYEKILSNIQEVKARRGKIISLVSQEDEAIRGLSDEILKVPQTHELLSPILNVIPLQLLAYFVADAKDIDPDKPRNLAKSVTVE